MQISITTTTSQLQGQAQQIAQKFNFIYHSSLDINSSFRFQLQLTEQHLQLVDRENISYKPLVIDFIAGKTNHRRLYGGGKSQLLAKAVGLNKGFKGHIVDATAGLGGDSFVMAWLGGKVSLVERSPVLAAMLSDAIQRAQTVAEIKSITQSMQLIHSDSLKLLCDKKDDKILKQADIIYLDPMYPEKKGSALVKKEMLYLQQLLGKDLDASQLLDCAIEQAKYRVVVKRPIKAPFLNQQKPLLQLSSKKQRFDIYIKQKLP